MAAAKIKTGLQECLYVGNVNSQRDWGYAPEYVEMMWMILQAEEPEDWVIATGKTTSVRDFVTMAFDYLGVTLKFEGKGIHEKGIVTAVSKSEYNISLGQEVIGIDEKYFTRFSNFLFLSKPHFLCRKNQHCGKRHLFFS